MSWQELTAWAIVAACAIFAVLKFVRRSPAGKCGCGCSDGGGKRENCRGRDSCSDCNCADSHCAGCRQE